MSAYQLHQAGDCGPGCGPCANECAGCLEWLHECVCPTLPLDEYRDVVNRGRLLDAEEEG